MTGTITAFKFPRNKYIITTTNMNAINNVLYTSFMATLIYVALLKAISRFRPSGKLGFICLI